MKVLIVGAGIAGAALAFWLERAGHEPTLVERAPEARRGGYLIDFWGAGFDVADRMGIVPALTAKGFRMTEVRQVDAAGRQVASFDPAPLVESSGGRYVSIARGDLASVLYDALGGRIETLFGDTVRSLDDGGDRVHVGFEGGSERDFDLVVGADGLHSRVRRLVFGPDAAFERFLGISVCAFDVFGYQPRDEDVAVMHTAVGYQITRLAMPGDRTVFLLTFVDDGRAADEGVEAQRETVRARLGGAGWEAPAILERLEEAQTLYFDRVSQVRMPTWTRGRIALVGDAAACPSLLAGQRSALALVEAYVLASELGRAGGDHAAAFAGYERMLGPFLRSKQVAAERLTLAFAPRSRFQLWLRNAVMKLMSVPFVSELAMGRTLRDAIELPAPPGG